MFMSKRFDIEPSTGPVYFTSRCCTGGELITYIFNFVSFRSVLTGFDGDYVFLKQR